MSETFKRGDRVIVRDVVDGTNRDYVGRVGTLRIVSPDGRYVVLMDGPGDVRIVATAVESLIETLASAQERVAAQSPVAVGDRVVIRAVRHPNCERYVGRTGRVEHVFISPDLKGNYKVVLDRGFAARIIASAVEAIPERDQRELSTSERALYAAENHDWRDEASELDRRRTQAAEFAHRTLGADALLEDLIGLADWILAETEEKVTGAEQTADHYIFTRGGFIPGPNVGPLVDEQPQEPPRPPADQRITDKDGDALRLTYNHTLVGTVALIEAHSHGDVCSAYVTAEDADRIIAFLQAAKAAKA